MSMRCPWDSQVVSEESLEQISQMQQFFGLSFKRSKVLVSPKFKD